MKHDNKWQRQEVNKLPEFTEEDLLNVQKWQTATSMMIEGKMRTPYSNEEYETGDKLKRLVDFRKFVLGVLDRQDKELREIYCKNLSLDGHVVIQHILKEAGDEIQQKQTNGEAK